MSLIAFQMMDQIAIKIITMDVIYNLDKTVLQIRMDRFSLDNIA